ncbi:MAG TPA: dienelactone hydrolase family protein [Anaerolineales bacterium]|nr:dienelactone hydrolase family protein [Anaerolineales bacterium]
MKLLKRILIGILIAVVALVLLLFGSIAIDAVASRGRIDQVANTVIPGLNGGPDVRAYVARPQGEGPFPVVIMIHEFMGLNDSITGRADLLAESGYLVIAPDTFRGSTTSWLPRAIYLVITTKAEAVNADLDSVYAWLETQEDVSTNRIGIAGFCYGGRTSLAYSLHNPKLAATVIFYGAPETEVEVLKTLPGPVLGIFGGADTSIPVETVNAFESGLEQAGIPHQITIYEGQPHAFVSDKEKIEAGGAPAEAWNEMLEFLEENLKNKASQNMDSAPLVYKAPFTWRYYLALAFEHAFGEASHVH